MTDLLESPTTNLDLPHVRVRPLTGHIGAQIEGIDLSRPLSDEERALVSDVLATWKVGMLEGGRQRGRE